MQQSRKFAPHFVIRATSFFGHSSLGIHHFAKCARPTIDAKIHPMPRLPLILSLLLLLAADAPKKPTTTPAKPTEPWQTITDKDIASITYEDAEVDSGFVPPLAQDLSNLDDDSKKELNQFADKLDNWIPGQEKDLVQQV